MSAQGLFITATDTGVGKTVVTAAILAYLRQQGEKVGVMKPIETGVDSECSSSANSDALFLMECGEIEDKLAHVSPIRLKTAVSPYQAGIIENRILEPEMILSTYKTLSGKHEWMLVEGIGGVRVPITRHYGVVELMRDLGLPVVVVARYQIGTLNHTLLTLETLKQNKIPVKGVIFNQCAPGTPDTLEQEQPSIIEELSGTRVLGELPYINNLNTQSFSPDKLKELETTLNFSELIQK